LVKGNALLRATLLLALGASACSAMLGLEDAHVDATLEGGASKAGSGGSEAAQAGSAPNGGKASALAGNAPSEAEAGSDAEAGSAAGGAMTVPEPTLCERYCTLVQASCSGQLEQYRSLEQCLLVCERLPAGEPGDEQVNTVECRMRQAHFAQMEPPYCKSAGPLGQDKCGSNCASFCALMQASCTPASTAGNLEPSYYLDDKACLAACDELTPGPDDPTAYSSSLTAVPSSYVGNSVFCRTYHVTAGLEQAAEDEHCPHAMGVEFCTAQ
jgi:hypothetical protein